MNYKWKYALPSWRARDSDTSGKITTTVSSAVVDGTGRGYQTPTPASSRSGKGVHGQGLAAVGLGSFKIGELHAVIRANLNNEEDGGFCPGGLIPTPESFQGKSVGAATL